MAHELDLARMRRERFAKLQAEMERAGVDALYLLTSGSVLYASGAWMLAADNGRATFERSTVLVIRGDDAPHVFTPYPEGAPPELPADHLHAPLWHDTDAGVEDCARTIVELLGGSDAQRLALDDYTAPMWFGFPKLLAPLELANANPLVTASRLHKTADELECMRRSWRINEAATYTAERGVARGHPPH